MDIPVVDVYVFLMDVAVVALPLNVLAVIVPTKVGAFEQTIPPVPVNDPGARFAWVKPVMPVPDPENVPAVTVPETVNPVPLI